MPTELPTLYQDVIAKTKYSRWREDLGRRETWLESVERLTEFYYDHCRDRGTPIDNETFGQLVKAIGELEVSPSMRAMMTAGPALERDNVAAYNCAYLAINRIKAFSEVLYILCCGTGVGFSVERQFVSKLPEIPEEFYATPTTIVVPDSKIGWATSFHELLSLLYAGKIPQVDYSKIRPAGAVLKTFGGRASGPGPLRDLFEYTIDVFRRAAGRKLNSDECHGIVCKIGDIVVVGGVRRSALISLFNPSDERMLNAKTGNFPPHYHLANNSAAWTEKPDIKRFLKKWTQLIESENGEPGIFNRAAAQRKVESIGRDPNHEFGLNPCGEIILRDRQFCNLTEITVRAEDNLNSLAEKVRLATILGMIQSTFTNFRYISKKWQENCEEERLLGVSFTGLMDHKVLSGQLGFNKMGVWLADLREVAWKTAREWAEILDINVPAAIATGKPSGNNSQRLNTASGAHARYDKLYVRRIRMNKNDPIAQALYMAGIPCEDEIFHPDTTWVFSFPQEAPAEALTRHDITALYQLEHWLTISRYWCDHNQSITINVRPDEWLEVGAFVYKNFDEMLGVSFMPDQDHVYQQAPYESITQEQYDKLLAELPEDIDWTILAEFEKSDQTEGAKELACVAGSCEV
jgi:ribonucleoside-triphosphate reductase